MYCRLIGLCQLHILPYIIDKLFVSHASDTVFPCKLEAPEGQRLCFPFVPPMNSMVTGK